MKQLILILLFFPLFSCGPREIDINDLVRIQYGEEVLFSSNSLKFEDILTDSRCPKGAECIIAGWITAEFIWNDTITIELSVPGINADTTGNYIIKLMEVNPYPETGKKIRKQRYNATVEIVSL